MYCFSSLFCQDVLVMLLVLVYYSGNWFLIFSLSPEFPANLWNTIFQVKESKWLVKCFLNYLRHDKTEINVLFDILSIFLFRTRIDFTFLKEFYIIEVCLLGCYLSIKFFL